MPVAILETPPSPLPLAPPRKRWTRNECECLRDAGALNYDDLELIDGELINTMSKGRPHSNTVLLLRNWLLGVFGLLFVQQETPIDVAPGDNALNEPEPDLAVTSRPFNEYSVGNPPPSDICIVIEVSHTTLAFDRSAKAGLYARAEIADYWIVDIANRQILVHRDPREGQYRSITAYSEQETIAPLAAPNSPFPVRNAFAADPQA
jgi:Uma2 family endonuclease